MTTPEETQNKTDIERAFEDFQQTRFYQWCDGLLVGRFHWLVVPITGFVDAFVVVLPTEVVLAVYLMRDRARNFLLHTSVVALCATVGYVALALFAAAVDPGVVTYIAGWLGEELTTNVAGIFTSYVFILAISAGVTSVFPMPATAFALVVGLLGAPVGWFALGTFVGKFIRFGSFAWLAREYGMRAFDFYMKNATWMSLVLVILIGLYFYIK